MTAAPALAALLLLLLAAPAMASGTSAATVAGDGDFAAQLGTAAWAAPAPLRPIELRAASLRLVVVDDVLENQVAHPLNASKNLYASHRQDRTERDFSDATLRLRAAGDPDGIIVVRSPAAAVRLDGPFTLRPEGAQELDRSHFRGSGLATPDQVHYEVLQPPSLRVEREGAAATPQQAAEAYAWGTLIEVAAGGETWSFRTGAWDEPGPAPATHVAHAWIELDAPAGSLDAPGARLWAASLELAGAGSLRLVDGEPGAPAPMAEELAIDGGRAAFGLGPGVVRVLAVEPEPAAPLPASLRAVAAWGWAGISVLLAIPAAGLAPAAYGRFLQRRGRIDALLAGRARRAEAYAAIAARLDVRGHPRLARLMAARAVANQPHVAGHRIEHAIHLQRLGRLHEAVREHEAAHVLMALPSDRNEIALNAFHAALACVRLHRDSAAAWWLQMALRHDPGLEADLGSHPGLSRLRRHPQVRMLVP